MNDEMDVSFLADLTELEDFTLYGSYIKDYSFFYSCLTNLKNIEDISPLVDKQFLGAIRLVDTGIEDIEPLKNLDSLRWLGIYGNNSEKMKEQSELYFSDVEYVKVKLEIPSGGL